MQYALYQTFEESKIRIDAMRYAKDSKFYNLEQAEEAFNPDNRKENYNFVGIMEADNLNHAFELSNTGKNIKGAYSMSVGDVLVNMHTGKTFIVAPISFHQLYKGE
jgi:hypothetical protein